MKKWRNRLFNSGLRAKQISEEVGFSKPDKRIFELAFSELNVQAEDSIFVRDDIEKDIDGCQNANIKGIWFYPHEIQNNTEIKPFAEIHSFDRLLGYFLSEE